MNTTDLLILQEIYRQDYDPSRRDRPGYSVSDLAKTIHKSTGFTQGRLAFLRGEGYLTVISGRIARSIHISNKGVSILTDQGLLPKIRNI